MLSTTGLQYYSLTGRASSIFDAIKPLDPLAPNKEPTEPQMESTTIFDHYTPMKHTKANYNKNCYWDKRSLKIKADIEKSVKMHTQKQRQETLMQEKEVDALKMAESANRRSSLEGTLYLL